MSDTKYTTFIDNAGRAIFGVVQSETQDSITVENPVMIVVNQQQNGQMAVQLFPIFFQEFVVESNSKSNVAWMSTISIPECGFNTYFKSSAS